MQEAERHEEWPVALDDPNEDDSELRTAPRFTLLIRTAKLIAPEGEFLCVIRDVSETGISIRTFHPLPQCDAMTIELQNGDSYEAEMVWQEEEKAGLRFADAADIERIVAMPSRFSKRPIRVNVEAAASINTLSGGQDATIHNISQQGASIICDTPYAIDQKVKLKSDCLPQTNAKIRWRRDDAMGLIFEDTYQFGELARIVQKMRRD